MVTSPPKLAETFGDKRVPVDLLVMLDSTMPTSPPSNVKRCVNMYQDNGTPDWARVFRGTSIDARSSKTEMINIDIRKLAGKDKTAGINHFNIDANPWVHDLIVQTLSSVKTDSSSSNSQPVFVNLNDQTNRSQETHNFQSPIHSGQRPGKRRR